MMKKRILIAIDTSRASGRQFLAGVARYVSASEDWEILINPPEYLAGNIQPDWPPPGDQDLDGLLIRDATATTILLQIDKPKVINDTQQELIPGTSTIMTDSQSIGRMAAEYFLDLGFRNFAFSGFAEMAWSRKRWLSYETTLRERGVEHIYEYPLLESVTQQGAAATWQLSEWLKTLPHPLCVFACNDDAAVYVLQACKMAGLAVPEEIAVIGVDNDELVCNLSSPPLSSIIMEFDKAGYIAAQHLDALIEKKAENQVMLVHPTGIAPRRSTDILVIDDRFVSGALRFIRAHFQTRLQTRDVVSAAHISRRELEKRFRKILGRTIKQEIDRLRIEYVKKRLVSSNQSVHQIADGLAFTDPEHFSRYFKNATGKTPAEFRKEP